MWPISSLALASGWSIKHCAVLEESLLKEKDLGAKESNGFRLLLELDFLCLPVAMSFCSGSVTVRSPSTAQCPGTWEAALTCAGWKLVGV